MQSLYWVRNDLRLLDNLTLAKFCSESQQGSFLWTPSKSYARAGRLRQQFFQQCLDSFSTALKARGQELITSPLKMSEALPLFLKNHSVDQIFFTREYSHEEVAEEEAVKKIADHFGVSVIEVDQSTLIRESDLPFSLSQMPKVFTDFKNKVEKNLTILDCSPEPVLPPPLGSLSGHADLDKLKALPNEENQARQRLQDYLWNTQSIKSYAATRSGLVKDNDSTRLSAWLSLGVISARTIHHELAKYELQNPESSLSAGRLRYELLWRDYFKFLSRKFGAQLVDEKGLKAKEIDEIEGAEHRFQLWISALTGQSFIDSNMNQINQTGFMSDRGRQNVASFLIHHLQVPWTWGADYFERILIDFDPDINNGNWLYLSGRGTDPRSRVFNPVKQAETYDPNFEFQKKWRSAP